MQHTNINVRNENITLTLNASSKITNILSTMHIV